MDGNTGQQPLLRTDQLQQVMMLAQTATKEKQQEYKVTKNNKRKPNTDRAITRAHCNV